jgi:hypothetical protein
MISKGGEAVAAQAAFTDSLRKAGVLLELGGYWMIQARSKEEAVEWVRRLPAADDEVIEIRQVQEIDDVPPEVQQLTG